MLDGKSLVSHELNAPLFNIFLCYFVLYSVVNVDYFLDTHFHLGFEIWNMEFGIWCLI